ncbi:uncharacterized protein LOC114187858 [Vigna unguiculata]|uniref:uncharacterized protein LOC114187858 n=1 Tax=Vigna unguiculata TaxID=3917 RepID=UPI001017202D|nr:uncharacterized protein LOC114187858 [Vigna unguiculata]
MCLAENKLAFTMYMLTGEAKHWWISMKSIMEKREEPVTWEAFRGKFLSEYFPDSVRYAKEVEFLQLTQGGKMVADYAEKFKHLSRFYTLPLDEEWRCRIFENNLRGDIHLMRNRGNRPQATGRVYAVTGAEAAGSVKERQLLDGSLNRVREQLGSDEAKDFALGNDGILRFQGRDLKETFWWKGMKKEVAQLVFACLTCKKAKVEHQRPSGILQPLEISVWKWNNISMDFVTHLPRTFRGHDTIWVIVDRLTKSGHFLAMNLRMSIAKVGSAIH